MKKKLTLLLLTVFCIGTTICKAVIVEITVTNFQFSPANPTVNVGDVVRFRFLAGFHNVTQDGVTDPGPAGAAPINSGAPASGVRNYDYTVTLAGLYKFYCVVHAGPATNPSDGMAGIFTASGAMPVELKDFSVGISPLGKPMLLWQTLTEQNVSHFSIRKSINGYNYNEISTVTAVGNSTTLQSYSFTDNSISNKEKYVYYTLKIVDRDGKEKITAVKMFKNPNALKQLITRIGPNPITRPGQLMVQFNSEKNGAMDTKVFDAAGKMIFKTSMVAFAGLNSGHVHICDFNPGTYTIQFEMDGIKETKRVMVR